MQRTPITLKLALTLAVPIVVLAVATTLGVRATAEGRAEVRRQTELAEAAIGPAGVLSTLQNERIWVIIDVLEFDDDFINLPVRSYDEAYGQTDAAIDELRQRVSGDEDDIVTRAFSDPVAGLDGLAQIRTDVDRFRISNHDLVTRVEFIFDIWDAYTALLAPFYDATTSITSEIEDASLREGARLSDNVARCIEAFSRLGERTVVISLLTDGGADTREEIVELSQLRANLDRYSSAIATAKPPYDEISSIPEAQQMIDGVQSQAGQAIATSRIAIDNLFESVLMPQGQGLFALQDDVHRIINVRVDQVEADAETRQLRLVTLGLVGLALVILFNLLISRSITRPLRSLTHQAEEVAQRRLPAAVEELLDVPTGADVPIPRIEPVTVDTADEIAEVAGALNTVQTSVVDLAAQQAVYRRNISDLFVTLNGRNQELLRRQTGLLGELATPQALPSTHASLAQLDHLATQMRRNTESLLAVAGVDARRVWQAPVDIDEVISYALGGVGDTSRLVIHPLEPASVAGANAGDLVHLLSEVIESALSFASIERRPVELRGGPTPETGGYWLAVIDFGAIMTPREVQAANLELSGDAAPSSSPATGVSTSASSASSGAASSLEGHALAGHLAKRAGVTARLDSSAGWGVTITIDIPANLLVRRPTPTAPDLRTPAPPPPPPPSPTPSPLP